MATVQMMGALGCLLLREVQPSSRRSVYVHKHRLYILMCRLDVEAEVSSLLFFLILAQYQVSGLFIFVNQTVQ